MNCKLFVEVHYYVRQNQRDIFLQKIKQAGIIEASQSEAGNQRYEYFYPINDLNQLVLFEIWNTPDDQKKHSETKHYQLLSELKKQYVEKTEIKTFFIK